MRLRVRLRARRPLERRHRRRRRQHPHRPHHVVVFVIEDVAVPDVAWPRRGVERKRIEARNQIRFLRVLRREPHRDARDLSRRRDEGILPSALGGDGGSGGPVRKSRGVPIGGKSTGSSTFARIVG